jgi:imidazolonepropionase
MSGLTLKGSIKDEQLQIIENAGLVIDNKTILEVASFHNLKTKYSNQEINIVELEFEAVCLPAFIDSHTHICFAGSRANDFAMRNAGKSYLDIAKSGGGIWDTVTKTRQASLKELIEGINKRAQKLLESGITTIEVKSGYGLSVEHELKMLDAIHEAKNENVADLIPTCLAAHIKPKDYDGNHKDYLEYIANDLFPILKERNLTNRIDAFIEEEAFDGEIISKYFNTAKSLGFDITVHADQFTTGGSEIAVKHNAVSADHLEVSTQKEIDLLANSNVISVALPGATLGLGCDFTPARKILDAGGALAIASDWNPGSGPMGDLITQASILATFQKLSTAEVFAAITFRAAATLRLSDRGVIEEGKKADLVIYRTDSYTEILYHQGQLKPNQVWKNGQCVYSNT